MAPAKAPTPPEPSQPTAAEEPVGQVIENGASEAEDNVEIARDGDDAERVCETASKLSMEDRKAKMEHLRAKMVRSAHHSCPSA